MRNIKLPIYRLLLLLCIIIGIGTTANLASAEAEWKIPDLQIKFSDNIFSAAKCGTDSSGKQVCQVNWIAEYIAAIYKYMVGVVGILAVIVMMFGGVRWIVAGGNASSISEAKAWISSSLTGLVLVLSSYMILYYINPNLLRFRPLSLQTPEILEFIDDRTGKTATSYQSRNCPSAAELQQGVSIYTTGYYKPPYGTDLQSLCMISMNCSCPNGRDSSKNCDQYFPNFKNYRPCNPFPETTAYCNRTGSGVAPKSGDIAAPDCMPFGTMVCITDKNGNKTTYTVRDRGSAIQGRRIDIWSSSLKEANQNTGEAYMIAGDCVMQMDRDELRNNMLD